MVENTISAYLRSLPSHQIANLKSHADAADHENHPSFHSLKEWGAAVLGVGITGTTVWKIIKTIQNH